MNRAIGILTGVMLLIQTVLAGDLTVQLGFGGTSGYTGVSPILANGVWSPVQFANGVLRPEIELGVWHDHTGQHYNCYCAPCINYDGWWGMLTGLKLAASSQNFSERINHPLWFEGGLGLLFQRSWALGYTDDLQPYDYWFGKRESNVLSQWFGRMGIKMNKRAALMFEGVYLYALDKDVYDHTFDYLMRIGLRWNPFL
ncbi:hypothetical protein KKC97_14215 [bacterium]|nr:hypothetical protein [bacterium]